MDDPKVKFVLENSATVSDKIRALAELGLSRSAIADLVNRSYQQVRNVLANDQRRESAAVNGMAEASAPYEAPSRNRFFRLEVMADGTVRLPPEARAALNIGPEGGGVVTEVGPGARVEMISSEAAVKRAQDIVAKFKVPGRSVVDEFLAERRQEAEREQRELDG